MKRYANVEKIRYSSKNFEAPRKDVLYLIDYHETKYLFSAAIILWNGYDVGPETHR
jgi:hypothetical protein